MWRRNKETGDPKDAARREAIRREKAAAGTAWWKDFMESLDDRGKWQRPTLLASMVLVPLAITWWLYTIFSGSTPNNTYTYIVSPDLIRAVGHEISAMPGGRDVSIRACNLPAGSQPALMINDIKLNFEQKGPWEGMYCVQTTFITPGNDGKVSASNVPGRLVTLARIRKSVNPDGSGQDVNWKVIDEGSDQILAKGVIKIEGAKPLTKTPSMPTVQFTEEWGNGRALKLVNHWTRDPAKLESFVTTTSSVETVFVPRNRRMPAVPFRLDPKNEYLIGDWSNYYACQNVPGTLFDYIRKSRTDPETRIISAIPTTIPIDPAADCN